MLVQTQSKKQWISSHNMAKMMDRTWDHSMFCSFLNHQNIIKGNVSFGDKGSDQIFRFTNTVEKGNYLNNDFEVEVSVFNTMMKKRSEEHTSELQSRQY